MSGTDAAEAFDHDAERIHGAALHPGPAMKNDTDQTAEPAGSYREYDQHDHRPEIEEQEDGGGPPERGRDGDGEDQGRDDQADGETVECALDHDGGQHCPEALPSARRDVGPDDLTRAERQDIVP